MTQTPLPPPSQLRDLRNQFLHHPPIQTTPFTNRTIIVTGANTGLGLSACKSFISLSAARIILACRNVSKAETAKSQLHAEFPDSKVMLEIRELDMNSYASCLAFVEGVKRDVGRVDAVVLNAGIWPTEFKISEGNEESVTTNVISTALLAFSLYPVLASTAEKYGVDTHLTVVSSTLHSSAKFVEADYHDGKNGNKSGIFEALRDEKKSVIADRYNVTKLLEIFLVRGLATLVPYERGRVIVTANGPGFTKSSLQNGKDSAIINFLNNHIARPTHVGARTLVFGASCPKENHGHFVPDCVATLPGGRGKGEEGEKLQERVWSELVAILEGIKKGVTKI